jgi:pimeloyl-ACP methyl ester carboxylesterase
MPDRASAGRPGPRFADRFADRNYAFAEAPRAMAEMAALLAAAPYLALAPRGDGHPVLVLPGYGGADGSTAVIRRYLAAQGLVTYPWGLGRNTGSAMPQLRERLAERLEQVWQAGGGRSVSLVGWSLGGVYARLLAQSHSEHIRRVITLGSPIGGMPPPGAVRRVPTAVPPDPKEAARLRRRAAEALPVPSTAVYSRTDGVVPWQFARQAHTERAENIEIYGSHIGMGFNAAALYLLADRLAQPEHDWQPFERTGWRRWVFGPSEP